MWKKCQINQIKWRNTFPQDNIWINLIFQLHYHSEFYFEGLKIIWCSSHHGLLCSRFTYAAIRACSSFIRWAADKLGGKRNKKSAKVSQAGEKKHLNALSSPSKAAGNGSDQCTCDASIYILSILYCSFLI